MNIKRIYTRFCCVLIFIMIILLNGKCVYAHNAELMEAIATSIQNPTLENLEYLLHLFEYDMEYHCSKSEIMEANRSEAMVIALKAKIAIESHVNPTEEDYKEIIKLLQLETELWSSLGDYEKLKVSLINMKQCEAKLYSLKAENALLKAQEDPTIENWEVVSQLSKELSLLYFEVGDNKMEKYCLAQALQFKAVAYFVRARENPTIKNWTEAATLYGEAFKIYWSNGFLMHARRCFMELVGIDMTIMILGGAPVSPMLGIAQFTF